MAVQRLAGMSASFPSQTGAGREPVLIGGSGTSFYPALLRPILANSHPAIVLSKSQPKIKEVDEEIHRAQEALRRLIESNKQSEEDRMEWTKESAEATIDAENLSVSLVIDLVGA